MENFELDVVNLEKQKETNHPLNKLTDLLDKWDREEMKSDEEILRFAHELWVTAGEFEKDLKESLKGHEIVTAMKEFKYQSHIDWLKNKLGFVIDYYDTAMNEMKLKSFRQVDRLQMQLCDLESRLLNC